MNLIDEIPVQYIADADDTVRHMTVTVERSIAWPVAAIVIALILSATAIVIFGGVR